MLSDPGKKGRIVHILLLALLLVFSVGCNASAAIWPFGAKAKPTIRLDYHLKVSTNSHYRPLQVNPFFLADILYEEIFEVCDLLNLYSVEEKYQIISEIVTYLSKGEVILVFDKFDGKNQLFIDFQQLDVNGEL